MSKGQRGPSLAGSKIQFSHGRLIVPMTPSSPQQQRVTYDFARLISGATELKCAQFGDAIIANMG